MRRYYDKGFWWEWYRQRLHKAQLLVPEHPDARYEKVLAALVDSRYVARYFDRALAAFWIAFRLLLRAERLLALMGFGGFLGRNRRGLALGAICAVLAMGMGTTAGLIAATYGPGPAAQVTRQVPAPPGYEAPAPPAQTVPVNEPVDPYSGMVVNSNCCVIPVNDGTADNTAGYANANYQNATTGSVTINN